MTNNMLTPFLTGMLGGSLAVIVLTAAVIGVLAITRELRARKRAPTMPEVPTPPLPIRSDRITTGHITADRIKMGNIATDRITATPTHNPHQAIIEQTRSVWTLPGVLSDSPNGIHHD